MTEDRHANALHTPADVRERAVRLLGLAMERAEWLCRDVGRAEWPLSDFGRDMLQARLDTVRDLIGDALAALRSEAGGEEDVGEVCYLCGEEFDPRESGTATGPLGQGDGVPRCCPRCARAYDAGYQQGLRRPRNDARQGEPRSAVEIYETNANDSGTLAED